MGNWLSQEGKSVKLLCISVFIPLLSVTCLHNRMLSKPHWIDGGLVCTKASISLAIWVLLFKQRRMQFNQSKDDIFWNRWPRTIAETMAIATKFMRFSKLIVLFSL